MEREFSGEKRIVGARVQNESDSLCSRYGYCSDI